MFKKAISLICCIIILILSLSTAGFVSADDNVHSERYVDSIIKYLTDLYSVKNVQQLFDRVFTVNAGKGAEWFALSLMQYNSNCDCKKYSAALEKYIKSTEEANPVTRQKNALALLATGYSGSLIENELDETVGKLGVMSLIFALHLMNNGVSCSKYTNSELIEAILNSRKIDGGWAISGEYSDIDVTALAIQALSFYKTDEKVKKAVDGAINCIISGMTDECEFKSYGKINSESTSQVILALSCMGIDCTRDSRFIKNGKTLVDTLLSYKNADGGYAHITSEESGQTAVFQALSAYVSLYMLENNKGSFYIFRNADVKKTEPVTTREKAVTVEGKTTVKNTEPATTNKGEISSTKKKSSVISSIGSILGNISSSEKKDKKEASTTSLTTEQSTEQITEKPSQTYAAATVTATAESTSQAQTYATTQTEVVLYEAAPLTEKINEEISETESMSSTEVAFSVDQSTQAIEETQALTEQTQTLTTALQETQTEQTTEAVTVQIEQAQKGTYKYYVSAAVLVAAILITVIMKLRKKGGKLTFILIFLAAFILVFLIFGTDIQSRSSYIQTDPVTDGISVTLSIRCDTVAGKRSDISSDGIILDKAVITVEKGSSVYDVLVKAGKEYSIQFENDSQMPADNTSAYISGINGLYEFDFGDLSGWVYRVNGVHADKGCGAYTVNDGDNVEFLYSCNLGEDVKVEIN